MKAMFVLGPCLLTFHGAVLLWPCLHPYRNHFEPLWWMNCLNSSTAEGDGRPPSLLPELRTARVLGNHPAGLVLTGFKDGLFRWTSLKCMWNFLLIRKPTPWSIKAQMSFLLHHASNPSKNVKSFFFVKVRFCDSLSRKQQTKSFL